jgi:hypothetical protein
MHNVMCCGSSMLLLLITKWSRAALQAIMARVTHVTPANSVTNCSDSLHESNSLS